MIAKYLDNKMLPLMMPILNSEVHKETYIERGSDSRGDSN